MKNSYEAPDVSIISRVGSLFWAKNPGECWSGTQSLVSAMAGTSRTISMRTMTDILQLWVRPRNAPHPMIARRV